DAEHAVLAEQGEDPVGARAEGAQVAQAVARLDFAAPGVGEGRLQGEGVAVDPAEDSDVGVFFHRSLLPWLCPLSPSRSQTPVWERLSSETPFRSPSVRRPKRSFGRTRVPKQEFGNESISPKGRGGQNLLKRRAARRRGWHTAHRTGSR